MGATITKQEMLDYGWTFNQPPNEFIFEKLLPNNNPFNNSKEDTDIKLVCHSHYNNFRFAVLFPDGSLLNFIANTIDELNYFENRLDFYDCGY